jgi:hypothetical protein
MLKPAEIGTARQIFYIHHEPLIFIVFLSEMDIAIVLRIVFKIRVGISFM